VARTEERRRHELAAQCELVLGGSPAETLMNALPPVGADLATKQDLSLVRKDFDGLRKDFDVLRHEMAGFRHEIKGDFDGLRHEMAGFRHEIKGDFDGLRKDFVGSQHEMHGFRHEMKGDMEKALRQYAFGLFFSLSSLFLMLALVLINVSD
jgi:hypothetical protein